MRSKQQELMKMAFFAVVSVLVGGGLGCVTGGSIGWWLFRKWEPLLVVTPSLPPQISTNAYQTPFLTTPHFPTPTFTITMSPTSSITLSPTVVPTPTPAATLWPDGQEAVIGYSVIGRPIKVYRFGQGADHRLLVGGIHGGYEWNTVALMEEFIRRLKENPAVVPEQVSLFILPVLNIDGYLDYKGLTYGRANANGVDLNRNFDAFWSPDWDRTHCWNYLSISAGDAPFSEPETQAFRDFLSWPGVDIRALINYHSSGAILYAGGRPPTENSVALATFLAQVSGFRYPPEGDQCEYTGQLIDWAAQQGIAAVDLELPDHHGLDFDRQWKVLQAFLWHWQP